MTGIQLLVKSANDVDYGEAENVQLIFDLYFQGKSIISNVVKFGNENKRKGDKYSSKKIVKNNG